MLESVVPGFVGKCIPVWLNKNQACRRLDRGVTGFFRLTKKGLFGLQWKTGVEFHGIIQQGVVRSTEEVYS